MAKEIKVEWCENWIRAQFARLPEFANAFECNHFWKMASKSGLYEEGTYGTPMSKAIGNLCDIEFVYTQDGKFAYNTFKLKSAEA